MCVFCAIVPPDVLQRHSRDKTLDDDVREKMRKTLSIDTELRKLRAQARKVSVKSHQLCEPNTIASRPSINLFDCRHSRSMPGAPITTPSKSPDPSAKRVYVDTREVVRFYRTVFHRNSIDDAGATLICSVHYGTGYNNAFWNGSQMIYGDGDGKIFLDLSRCEDVIAHELTHGVTQHSLQLSYVNEAGGLNESISDVFASMFRQWRAGQNVHAADWRIGANIMGAKAKLKGFTCLRDLAHPGAKHCLGGWQPTQYKQFKTGMNPHVSSGIANLAFHSIAKAVGGKSWEKAGQIWYNVLTGSRATPNMKMTTFANRTRKAASQLFPNDSAVANAVDSGWKQVGL
jgi:Zn-dependent metalloprotease